MKQHNFPSSISSSLMIGWSAKLHNNEAKKWRDVDNINQRNWATWLLVVRPFFIIGLLCEDRIYLTHIRWAHPIPSLASQKSTLTESLACNINPVWTARSASAAATAPTTANYLIKLYSTIYDDEDDVIIRTQPPKKFYNYKRKLNVHFSTLSWK